MSWDVASIYQHNFPSHDAIYFVKCTSPSCSKAPPQHDAATPVLHSWDGVLRLAILRLFPPNITMVIMAKQFYFCFIRPEGISLKHNYDTVNYDWNNLSVNNCWENYLCHAQSRCPNRLAKTSLLTTNLWSRWKTRFNDSNLIVCKLPTSTVYVCVCKIGRAHVWTPVT